MRKRQGRNTKSVKQALLSKGQQWPKLKADKADKESDIGGKQSENTTVIKTIWLKQDAGASFKYTGKQGMGETN